MALLSVDKRKEYFKYLKLGEYNKANILKVQKKYMLRESDWDGEYGPDTDALIRHLRNVKKFAPNFKPTEFRCGCGGKYCSGYPTRMKAHELILLQEVRDHYGKPMTVTSGLRCKRYNAMLSGSSQRSRHLSGYACDFYMPGVTDSLANRKKAIKVIKKLKHRKFFHYAYGNGINSYGGIVNAPNMGNAMHLDTE